MSSGLGIPKKQPEPRRSPVFVRPIVEAAPKIGPRKLVGIVPDYEDEDEHDDADDAGGESVGRTFGLHFHDIELIRRQSDLYISTNMFNTFNASRPVTFLALVEGMISTLDGLLHLQFVLSLYLLACYCVTYVLKLLFYNNLST